MKEGRECRYCGGPVEAHMKMDRCRACKRAGKGRKKTPGGQTPVSRGEARDRRFEDVYRRAHECGMLAGTVGFETATPMYVQERSSLLDDASSVVRQWGPIAGGCCGFAWVDVHDRSFCNWLKRTGRSREARSRKAIWVSEFGQSMAAKEAYARAFAEVLVKHGIRASYGSRMD